MNITQLTRKAAFAPILIGCLNLLALSLWFLQARTIASRAKPVTIRHFLPKDDGDEFYSAPAVLRRYSAKTQVQFQLNGQPADMTTLNAIHISALTLKSRVDTTKIIKVTLTDDIPYGEVIELINIVKRIDLKRYMLWKNDFYILPPGSEG